MPEPELSTSGEPSLVAFSGEAETVRVRLNVAYDGTDFSGWAVQRDRRTVQGVLEAALAQIVRSPVRLTVAGRTDAGVHARGQVAHADLPADSWAALESSIERRLGGVLPGDVRVLAAALAPSGFDARFSAIWRSYEYRLTDSAFGAEPLRRRDTVAWPRHLDEDAMTEAAVGLLGLRDFAAYCRYREGATTIRGLQRLDVARVEGVITIAAQADAFCHSMVRSLVGALLAVGEQRKSVEWPAQLLTSTSRSSAVAVAPAHGLTLIAVGYPPDSELAARARVTRNVRLP